MRKITAIILAISMTLSLAICTYATTLEKPDVMYDYEKDLLTVSGVTTPDEEVTIYVMNPGYDRDSVYTYGETAVQNFRVVKSDANGEYVYSLKLADAIDDETYTVYVKADGKTEASNSFVYAGGTTIERITSALIGEYDASVIETVLTTQGNAEFLQINNFDPFIQADITKLSTLLARSLKDQLSSGNKEKDFAKLIDVIREISVVHMYNHGRKDVISADNNLLYSSVLTLNTLDEQGRNLYTSYNTVLSSKTKAKVIDALMGKDFLNAEELKKKLAEEIVLKGIPNTVGYGHVEKLLTSANCAYLGMTYKSINNAQATKIVNNIPEQDSIADLESEIIKILDNPPGGGGGGGGSVPPADTGYFGNGGGNTPQVKASSGKNHFNDVEEFEWADEAIGYLYEKKIISGTSANTFAPADNLTREQFAKVLCILKGIDGKTTEEFYDVETDVWYAPYIGALAETGLIRGIGGGAFGVGYNLSRQDLCVMLYRAFEDKIPEGEKKTFTDSDSVSDYANEAVRALSGAGILNGFTDGTFRPQANCTRAEMAKIIYEVSKLLD